MSVITTGFDDLDNLIGGFRPGDLIVVASLTGMGKSALVQNFASHATLTLGIPSLVFSLAEAVEEIQADFISSMSSVDVTSVLNGTYTPDESRRVAAASTMMDCAPLMVVDDPMLDITGVVARARAAVALDDVGMIVVDPVQWLAGHGNVGQLDVACHELKQLAVETDTVVIVTSQLDRRAMVNPYRPRIEELTGVAGILSHVDVAMVLDRPDFYSDMSVRAGEADLIVSKNRHGDVGLVVFAHQLHYSRFVSMARG